MYSTCRVVGFLIKKKTIVFQTFSLPSPSWYRKVPNGVESGAFISKNGPKIDYFLHKKKVVVCCCCCCCFFFFFFLYFLFSHLSNLPLGTDHQKSYGGKGREIFEPQEFFSLSNSLYEFFLGHRMNTFVGLIGVHEFFHLIFLARIFFCTSPAQTPHKFSNGPSLRAFFQSGTEQTVGNNEVSVLSGCP